MKESPARKAARPSTLPKKRILIVDDHAIVRDGLVEVINRAPEMEVCGQAGDAFAALELAASMKPDLAVVDIHIGGKNGLELIKDLHVQHPQIAILALSAHDETLYAERVLRAGGHGYVMKSEGSERLIEAIRQVLAGETAVSAKVSAKVVNLFAGRHADISPIERLSDRELEIFQLIGRGKETNEIAALLHISPKTVEAHRMHIREKLQIASLNGLISFAARWIEANGTM
jgi:DNA-binding NarL/FixJ family response regulator